MVVMKCPSSCYILLNKRSSMKVLAEGGASDPVIKVWFALQLHFGLDISTFGLGPQPGSLWSDDREICQFAFNLLNCFFFAIDYHFIVNKCFPTDSRETIKLSIFVSTVCYRTVSYNFVVLSVTLLIVGNKLTNM